MSFQSSAGLATNRNNSNFSSPLPQLEALGLFHEVRNSLIDEIAKIFDPSNRTPIEEFARRAFSQNNPINLPSAPVTVPAIPDSHQPAGSLRVQGNVISTAGGYKVEVLGVSEWKITGPDGQSSTRIWGDPHVHESDRGESANAEGNGGWDFKRSSTFVLGDGTRINVTTVPGGAAGATVTGGLELISGNERVVVSDMEKGMGIFGQVTQDGYSRANAFQGDVFVMVNGDAADWSLEGREITGSEGQGESFQLSDEMVTLDPLESGFARGIDELVSSWISNYNSLGQALASIFRSVLEGAARELPTNRLGSNPSTGSTLPTWEDGHAFTPELQRSNLTRNFQDLGRMFSSLAQLSNLNDNLAARRSNTNIYA